MCARQDEHVKTRRAEPSPAVATREKKFALHLLDQTPTHDRDHHTNHIVTDRHAQVMSQVLPRRMGCSAGRAACSVAFGRHRRVPPVALALQQQQQRRTKTAAAAPTLAKLAARGRGGGGRARGGGEQGSSNIVHQHPQRAFSSTAGGKTNPIKAKITGSLLDARVHVVGDRGIR